MLHFLFNGHDMKFLTPVMNFIKAQDDIEVKVQKHRGHVLNQAETKEAEQLNAWADIVFCEWALGNAVWFSQHKRPGQLLVVRMHAQEFHNERLPYVQQIDWENVDALVVICSEGRKFALERLGLEDRKVHLIYNPLDIFGRFSLQKAPYSDFTLGMLGRVPWMKRPDLALEVFQECRKRHACYQLRYKGKGPEDYPWMLTRKDEMAHYSEFQARLSECEAAKDICFDGFDPEPGRWYARCGFILSTSDYEGSHQAVAEGMAEGCIPVIRDWIGADEMYPAKYIWHDVADAAELIQKYRAIPQVYWSEASQCRSYAVEKFDARPICLAYDKLFAVHSGYCSLVRKRPLRDMKVAILAYVPPLSHNGYRVRVEQFVLRYLRLGLDVTLLCLHNGRSSDSDVKRHQAELEELGCRVRQFVVPWFFGMTISAKDEREFVDAMLPYLKECGISWVQCEAAYCARVGLLLKKAMPGLCASFDCHGVMPEELEMNGDSEARVRFAAQMETDCIERSDFTVFVACAMRTHYMSKYGLMPPSAIVPCCIREESLRDSIHQEEVLPGLPKDRPVLGYLGTMVAWQCKDEMFRLFGKLHRLYPDIYFVVLTPKSDQKAALDLLAENGIMASDFRVQELPFEKVPAALVRFNAGMMLRKKSPVNRAASPTKFGEMIAAGVPVIATDEIGDYSEDVKKNGFGLIVPFDELDSMEFSDETCKNVYDLLVSRKNEDRDFIAATSHYCRESLLWDLHAQKLVQRYWELFYIKV